MDEATFYGLPLTTAPGQVFTPRATTEALVDAALARIGDRPARVADVGTGTGAIAVAIAANAPHAEVWATDTNADAVALARANAERNGVADRVHVVEGDLLEPLPNMFDVVVANLPYLPLATRDTPEHDALRGEPEDAVYAPGDGLGFLHGLLRLCSAGKLRMPGYVLLQFHGDVVEADCQHLDELDERLVAQATTAA